VSENRIRCINLWHHYFLVKEALQQSLSQICMQNAKDQHFDAEISFQKIKIISVSVRKAENNWQKLPVSSNF
jgi:hypothetical protein